MKKFINKQWAIDLVHEKCCEILERCDSQDIFNTILTCNKEIQNGLSEMPTADAIPIEFIEKRIAELKKVNEYVFMANGGFNSPSDYEQWELERVIRDWRAEALDGFCDWPERRGAE